MPPLLFIVLSGFCWIGVYVLLVKRGFQDKSYGMPLVGLSVNMAWESVFSLVYPIGVTSPARFIIFVWMLLDVLVVGTFFLYGYKYFEKRLTRIQFYVAGVLSLFGAYTFYLTVPRFLLSFSFFNGSMFQVASFLAYATDNLAVSVLFLNMFWSRRGVEGQSFYIGLLKWIGTLLVAVWYLLEHNYTFVWFIIVPIEIFDIIYMKLIYDRLIKLEINPWMRF
jgi:hypothetical protein